MTNVNIPVSIGAGWGETAGQELNCAAVVRSGMVPGKKSIMPDPQSM